MAAWYCWGGTGVSGDIQRGTGSTGARLGAPQRDWCHCEDHHGGTGMTVLGSEAPTPGQGSPQGRTWITVLGLGSLFWDWDRCVRIGTTVLGLGSLFWDWALPP